MNAFVLDGTYGPTNFFYQGEQWALQAAPLTEIYDDGYQVANFTLFLEETSTSNLLLQAWSVVGAEIDFLFDGESILTNASWPFLFNDSNTMFAAGSHTLKAIDRVSNVSRQIAYDVVSFRSASIIPNDELPLYNYQFYRTHQYDELTRGLVTEVGEYFIFPKIEGILQLGDTLSIHGPSPALQCFGQGSHSCLSFKYAIALEDLDTPPLTVHRSELYTSYGFNLDGDTRTASPTPLASDMPSLLPSEMPSLLPSDSPSLLPSDSPSQTPTSMFKQSRPLV